MDKLKSSPVVSQCKRDTCQLLTEGTPPQKFFVKWRVALGYAFWWLSFRIPRFFGSPMNRENPKPFRILLGRFLLWRLFLMLIPLCILQSLVTVVLFVLSFTFSDSSCILHHCNSSGHPFFRWLWHFLQFWSRMTWLLLIVFLLIFGKPFLPILVLHRYCLIGCYWGPFFFGVWVIYLVATYIM